MQRGRMGRDGNNLAAPRLNLRRTFAAVDALLLIYFNVGLVPHQQRRHVKQLNVQNRLRGSTLAKLICDHCNVRTQL